MVDIIGAPFDLCGQSVGSRLGPAAVRLAGLQETLTELGVATTDMGDLAPKQCDSEGKGLRHFEPLLRMVAKLREAVEASLARGAMPLVVGGEHTLAVGGISAALNAFGDDLAVLWIDAHADINTPGSSTSGNVHGMPLAALCGMKSEADGAKDQDWQRLLRALGPTRLRADHVAWYGLRDVDPQERPRLDGLAITMHEIDRRGVEATVRQLDSWLKQVGARQVWISFDVDALDPILAPGTGTAVRGGLTYREAHLCAELIFEEFAAVGCAYSLAGVDLVEVNPLVDNLNETAKMAVEWLASLLGKTILGPRT